MKTLPHLSLALAAALVAGLTLAPRAQAFTWGGKLDELLVAEQTSAGKALPEPKPDRPAYYVAFDGGYIEAGDPIAGENPPSPGLVAQALRQALASQNYQEAGPGTTPSLVLTYHWGVLNRDTHQVRSPFKMEPNLRARIDLIATADYAQRIETDIMDRRQPTFVRIPILDPHERELLDLAADDRFFVIVSAFDYAALTRGQATLLWRVKMSTRSAGVAMAEALPALLRGGAPYFGRTAGDSVYLRSAVGGPAPAVAPFAFPRETVQALDQKALFTLLRDESVQFSGIYADEAATVTVPTPSITAEPATLTYLPAPLAARIAAYQQQKAALQDALAARIKDSTPGSDTSQAIDAFNQQHAARIAALAAERESIRGELAKLAAAATDPAASKSLNTLLKDFAADAQQIESESAPGAK